MENSKLVTEVQMTGFNYMNCFITANPDPQGESPVLGAMTRQGLMSIYS